MKLPARSRKPNYWVMLAFFTMLLFAGGALIIGVTDVFR